MVASPAWPGAKLRDNAGYTSTCSGEEQAGQGVIPATLNRVAGSGALHLVQETAVEVMGPWSIVENHPRIADAVVQGPLFVVKRGDDKPNRAGQVADPLGKVTADSPAISHPGSILIHHADLAGHFPQRGA